MRQPYCCVVCNSEGASSTGQPEQLVRIQNSPIIGWHFRDFLAANDSHLPDECDEYLHVCTQPQPPHWPGMPSLTHYERFSSIKWPIESWYCTNCGSDFTVEESKSFEYDRKAALFHTICRRCEGVRVIVLPVISEEHTLDFIAACPSCDREGHFLSNLLYNRSCRHCARATQIIRVVEYRWSEKKRFPHPA